jgi:F-type H+-transporting ATPase subunit c
MTKKFFSALALLLLASSMLCAQTPGAPATGGNWALPFSAAFGMAIASGLCGLAQGKAIASSVEGMARNPGAAKAIQLAMLIGLAFIESLALYTLLIVFLKVT